MKTPLLMGETVLKKGGANHFAGIEAVGGHLYVTNKRVIFESHPLNLQNHILIIELGDILELGKRNTLGIVPNGIFIECRNGHNEKFVVNGRKKWMEEISGAMADLSS